MKEETIRIRPVITVRAAKEKVFMGPGVLMLLDNVVATGSVKEACRITGISYSKAWIIFNLAEQELGYPLILRRHGGAGGGGSVVSEAGLRMLDKYVEAKSKINDYAEKVFDEIFVEGDKTLSLALGIVKGDMVCMTGAGGKTSAMYQIGMEWQKERVLLTTSTKILYPESRDYDYIFAEKDLPIKKIKNGRNLIYGKRNADGKCTALEDKIIEEIKPNFDLTIIEADGSRGLPLKGYHTDEPCIPEKTNVVVGVATANVIGKKMNARCVCRPELFSDMVDIQIEEPITPAHIAAWIEHPQGMFGNSRAKKILFFNQIENKRSLTAAEKVVAQLSDEFKQSLERIVFGSVHNNAYEVLEK